MYLAPPVLLLQSESANYFFVGNAVPGREETLGRHAYDAQNHAWRWRRP